MITADFKKKVLKRLNENRQNFDGSDAKFAVSLGISNAQYSRIKNGELDRVISDANWISLARRCGVSLDNAPDWKNSQYAGVPIYHCSIREMSS